MASKNTNTTSEKAKQPTKAELESELSSVKDQLAEAMKVIELLKNAAATSSATAQPIVVNSAPASTDVTIVYCSDSLGYAKISNMELNFNRYGEEFLLNRYQFDELVGKYRDWFERGILAVSSKNLDVAIAKNLPTDSDYALSAKILASIGKMTPAQLEKLWNENSKQSHRECIVSYIKRKFIEGDPDFKNREKVDLMNRLTDGAFFREQDELSGRYKIEPTDMNAD